MQGGVQEGGGHAERVGQGQRPLGQEEHVGQEENHVNVVTRVYYSNYDVKLNLVYRSCQIYNEEPFRTKFPVF